MTTLPLPPAVSLLIGLLLITALLYGALSLMTRKQGAPVWEGLSAGALAALVPLAVIWLGVFGLSIGAVYVGIWRFMHGEASVSIGLGGLIAALLGAPFLIWSTILKTQTVRYQKEGHMTDRISKAVEQLGVEKTVRRDGVETTEPNIEVRIGAILSLERIAQDSTTHDKGRDHVRVMEILCAYIRENAPVRKAKTSMRRDFQLRNENVSQHNPPVSEEQYLLENNFPGSEDAEDYLSVHAAIAWARTLKSPREDVSIALKVIKNRSPEQIKIEREWIEQPNRIPLSKSSRKAHAHTEEGAVISHEKGFRLDLRNCNLQKSDLSGGYFNNALLTGTSLEGSYIVSTSLTGADFGFANLDGSVVINTNLSGAGFTLAKYEGIGFHNTDLSLVSALASEQLAACFGDASILLPDHLKRPDHWPDWKLPDSAPKGEPSFFTEREKWRANPDAYTPPPNPNA